MSAINPGPATTAQGPQAIAFGNIQMEALLNITLSPASVAANTTAEQAFTVTGLQLGDFVEVNKPSVQAGLGIVNTRVSAANTLSITFSNSTASPIIPTAGEVHFLCVTRPLPQAYANGLPSTLPLP
jgi:hypothetical protein